MSSELLTYDELAAKLKTTPGNVVRHVKRGAIPVVKLGGSTRFDWADVIAALKTQEGAE